MQYAVLLTAGLIGLFGWAGMAASSPSAVRQSVVPLAETILQPVLVDRSVTAKSFLVFDVASGQVLAEENVDVALPIASVTKLFTAAAAVESGQMSAEITILPNDVAQEGSAGKLQAGQVYTVRELLFPLLLESSNDAAAVFERVTPIKPVVGVSLADGSGLSDQNRATAVGLAMAAREVYLNQRHIFDITTLPQYVVEEVGWVNNSPVRTLPGYLGGKHGYTVAANRTLVAFFSEPAFEDRSIGYVILGSDDILADTVVLREAVRRSAEAK